MGAAPLMHLASPTKLDYHCNERTLFGGKCIVPVAKSWTPRGLSFRNRYISVPWCKSHYYYYFHRSAPCPPQLLLFSDGCRPTPRKNPGIRRGYTGIICVYRRRLERQSPPRTGEQGFLSASTKNLPSTTLWTGYAHALFPHSPNMKILIAPRSPRSEHARCIWTSWEPNCLLSLHE